ncbi:MAG: hypothetical protein LAO24_17975 [Acidobacteriia bacterium]|nr:hypothetical protein [Terriglobia bacterium]
MSRFILIFTLSWAGVCCLRVTGQNALSCDNANNTSANSRYRTGNSGNVLPGNVSKLPIRSLLYSGATTRIYVRYMPWFGDPHHRDVGYRSDDQQQVSRQVSDMISRGIQGAIVDWYGPGSGLKHESTLLVMKEAERQGFEFAISEDAGALGDCEKHGCNPTDQLISDLRYAAEHFEASPAYIRFNGRPAVFFFGLEKYTIDWHRVRQTLPLSPLLFFRNSGTFGNSDADGAYSWMAPETAGADDPMALKYLERFYSKAQRSSKIAMGSAYKGFNDSDASWGKGHAIDQQCGQTWIATFAEAGRFYSSDHQLPAMIIPTWNDYEEGTEIESGVDNCVNVRASITGDELAWSISGRENTIDHYVIMAEKDAQWKDLATLPAGSRSVQLHDLHLQPEVDALCVQAVGKPSMLNHSSGPLGYTAPRSQNQKP